MVYIEMNLKIKESLKLKMSFLVLNELKSKSNVSSLKFQSFFLCMIIATVVTMVTASAVLPATLPEIYLEINRRIRTVFQTKTWHSKTLSRAASLHLTARSQKQQLAFVDVYFDEYIVFPVSVSQ